jgi:hypothetical protein
MKRVLIGFVVVVIFLVIYSNIAKHITEKRIQDRTKYWESFIDSGIIIGDLKDKVARWIRQQHINLYPDPGGNFTGMLEEIPDAGGNFPVCGSWKIIVSIDFDKNGTYCGRKVYSGGVCL